MVERAYGVADPGARQPNARSDPDETAGRKAERLVHDRLRAAFPETVSGASRARQHLVVIASAGVLGRLW